MGLDDYQNYMRNNIYVGLSLPLIITLLYESAYFMKKWKSEFLKRQQLSEENAKAELQILKKQLDPHFMFNALGTLSSLIEDKPKQATDFVNEFSDVYRYILTNKDQNLAFLKDEITFVKSYITLLRYRFGNRVLLFDFNISSSYLNYKFPTLTLQMLIENAVKHNAFSEAKPLQVAISINEKKHTLCVKNNKQQKSRQVNSTGIGLENIAKRYALLTKNKISIKQDIESFEVCLPLI
ncbi:MAG: sensor histidine kinase [Chitinophagales bacterium]